MSSDIESLQLGNHLYLKRSRLSCQQTTVTRPRQYSVADFIMTLNFGSVWMNDRALGSHRLYSSRSACAMLKCSLGHLTLFTWYYGSVLVRDVRSNISRNSKNAVSVLMENGAME